ncbi:MAG: DUF455 family protein [Planctomycetes bacterium]|nr:DUF455 family protein [Planctomycetota bacterium]
MATALEAYVSQRRQGGLDVPTTVELLRRYTYLERAAIPALAGWFLAAPKYEDKIKLGYLVWGHAERADAMRKRLKELRGGHRDASIEPALQRLGAALAHAPGEHAFVAGLEALTKHLAEAYRTHLAVSDAAANAMERRILRTALSELESDRVWLTEYVANLDEARGAQARRWVDHLEGLLAMAGGVSGMERRTLEAPARPDAALFERPQTLVFDHRIQRGEFESFSKRLELGFEVTRVAELEIFFNEFYAAALLASILFDAWNADAPWEFFHDMAHHFWDEVRHAEFGLIRLRELGVEPKRVNLVLFDQAQSMPFLHRLCFLTLDLEVFYMPRKQPRVKRYGEAGDYRTQIFADVDWSDEGNHVRYGKKWVTHFLEDDGRDIADLQAEIKEHLKPLYANLPAGQMSPF